MKMTAMLTSAFLAFSLPSLAHDEGHGPKLTDVGKYGGIVSAVIEKKNADLGAKAPLIYKAELVRGAEGKVLVYIYDGAMKPLDAGIFDKDVAATLTWEKKGAYTSKAFNVAFDGKAFVGQMPSPDSKPYFLDFVFKDKERQLLSAFDNLD